MRQVKISLVAFFRFKFKLLFRKIGNEKAEHTPSVPPYFYSNLLKINYL